VSLEKKAFILRNGRERECLILGEKDSKMFVSFESNGLNGNRAMGYCLVEKDAIIYKQNDWFVTYFNIFKKHKLSILIFILFVILIFSIVSVNNSFNIVNIHINKNEKNSFHFFDYIFHLFDNNN
jgi:hypothetical protein